MKSFPTNFITEKNKKQGASPIWILKCPFPNTGTIYLSDQVLIITGWDGGITTKPWVQKWGQIDENLFGSELAISQVSDFVISVIDDPSSSPNMNTILWTEANKIETTDCELYLWFIGLNPATDPPQLIWGGNIIEFDKQDELIYNLQLADQSIRYDKYVGTVIDKSSYPNADPDEIGKVANILYGASKLVRCQAIQAGGVDTITTHITATSPGNGGTLKLSAASEFPNSGAFTIQIDYEQIRIASRSGKTLTLANSRARGYNGTQATAHNAGAVAYEILTEFVYLIADHKVKSIGDVLVDGVLQTVDYTTYTGQSGSQHDSYPNKAVVSFTVKPAIYKEVNLDVSTGLHAHYNASSEIIRPSSAAYSAPSNATVIGVEANIRDSSLDTYLYIHTSGENCFIWAYFLPYTGITPADVKVWITHKTELSSSQSRVTIAGIPLDSSNTKVTQGFSIGNVVPTTVEVGLWYGGSDRFAATYVYEIWLEIKLESSGYSHATGVALKGSSVADTVLGREVVATVDGYQDDASGTYTGTPNALIERPNHVIKHFLNTYANVNLSKFSTNTNNYFNTNNYKFSILINERKKLKTWLATMAWQCRSFFRFSSGSAYLTLRPDSLTSQKSITSNMIRMDENNKTTLKLARSPLEEVINKIKIYYNRDWLKTGEEAYASISSASDSTSITTYGEKENPYVFFFDFVTEQSMANHISSFYLARYKARKKLLSMEVFLDNCEIEFADALTIVPQNNLLVEVQKVNHFPGSGQSMRNDRILLIVKEY